MPRSWRLIVMLAATCALVEAVAHAADETLGERAARARDSYQLRIDLHPDQGRMEGEMVLSYRNCSAESLTVWHGQLMAGVFMPGA
jgi:hypothetical protein